ncbi:MAG TPA: acyl-CoA thioesterase/bile acid-CoA:amino acid N-acyltransferase family protein [Gaiellaceae bacterium]|nr:acyl-CoA thioesterase/bile acid-CoA:amino acid N-acyltransferase family protein [Gaiellaceae bacterium]
MRRILLAGLLVIVMTGCGASHRAARLQVTPASSVEDQPIQIRFDGLRRLQGVWLELRSTDATGTVFVSRAAFGADDHGVLDLARAQAQTGSTYSGVWQMGLLASMTAPNALPLTDYRWGSTPRRFVLTAISASLPIASVTFTRRWRSGVYKIVRETVAKHGFNATFYAPAGARHQAAVLAIGGHGSAWLGERLAADGIPALVIAYRRAPLEYFRTALEWLDGRSEVDARRVSVLGTSYGSETALLLGVHYPGLVRGVAAIVPSLVALPHTAMLDNPPLRAVIPVERISSPVFLACGGRDQVWGSCAYAHAIVARRHAHGESTQLIAYPNASHSLGRPFIYEPGALAGDFFVPADERAREDLWPRLLAFLHAA